MTDNKKEVNLKATAYNILTNSEVTNLQLTSSQQTAPVYAMGSSTAYMTSSKPVVGTCTITTTALGNTAQYVVYDDFAFKPNGQKSANIGGWGNKKKLNFILDGLFTHVVKVSSTAVETMKADDTFGGHNVFGAPQRVDIYSVDSDEIAIVFLENGAELIIGKHVNKLAVKKVVELLNQKEVKTVRLVRPATGDHAYNTKIENIKNNLIKILGVEVFED